MDNRITFGKDRYHRIHAMEKWCTDIIGPGGWGYANHGHWEGMSDKIWLMHSMFGYTTFEFKEPAHLTMFLLRWA